MHRNLFGHLTETVTIFSDIWKIFRSMTKKCPKKESHFVTVFLCSSSRFCFHRLYFPSVTLNSLSLSLRLSLCLSSSFLLSFILYLYHTENRRRKYCVLQFTSLSDKVISRIPRVNDFGSRNQSTLSSRCRLNLTQQWNYRRVSRKFTWTILRTENVVKPQPAKKCINIRHDTFDT